MDTNKLATDSAADNVQRMDDMIAETAAYLDKLKVAREAWAKVDSSAAWDAAADETRAAQNAKPKHKHLFPILLDDYC